MELGREGPGLSGHLVDHLPDGSIKTKVFRKETHTDQYLNFTSNHPLEHKRGVVRTLLHQAEAIVSDPTDGEGKKAHIKQALHWNGYPAWLLEGVDMPPLDQPAEVGVDPTLNQVGPSVEITAFEPPVLDR